MASQSKKRGAGVLTHVSISLYDPRVVEFDRKYIEDYDRLLEEQRQKEIKAEAELRRSGFVITY